ncbi:MAG: twin-arginine translocation signal domain-containing protein [Paracoccaceae bacterium]
MTQKFIQPFGAPSLILPDRRKFLGMAGAAGASAFISPQMAIANSVDEDPCAAALAVLHNVAKEVENPRPWAMNYGRDAMDHLRDKVDLALRHLDAAEKREEELEYAFWADMFSTVGGAAFTGIGVAAIVTGATVFAPVTLLVAGAAFGGLSYWGQTTFDGGPASQGSDTTLGGWLSAVGDPAGNTIQGLENINYAVDKFNLSKVFMIGKGVEKFAKIGGTSLSAITTIFSALEAWDTHKWEDIAEAETEKLRKDLESLQADLRQRTSVAYLAEMHQASAQSLLDDFQNGEASCQDGLIMHNPSIADSLVVPNENTSGGGSSSSNSGGTPALKKAPPRVKRVRLQGG